MSKIATVAVLIGIIIIAVIVGIFIITNPSTPAPSTQKTQTNTQTQTQTQNQSQPAASTIERGTSDNPQYDRAIPFSFQVPMKYPDFTLTFNGTEVSSSTIGADTTGTHHFVITDSSGATQKVDITFGKLPPQPTDFTVGGKTYTIATFMLPDGTQLPESTFVVLKK
jgi:hypothetical protein